MYTGQEATVRIGHGTKDWFQTGELVRSGCMFSLCLFNLHAEYIMQNAMTNRRGNNGNSDRLYFFGLQNH